MFVGNKYGTQMIKSGHYQIQATSCVIKILTSIFYKQYRRRVMLNYAIIFALYLA